MPATTLTFQGINRAISDFGQAGACEELINLRPTTEGLVPVKPFTLKKDRLDYAKIFTHYAGKDINYIGIKKSGNNLYFYLINDNSADTEIAHISVESAFDTENIHTAAAGNIILFSISDTATSHYQNISFIWDGDSYNPNEADIPALDASFTISPAELKTFDGSPFDTTDNQNEIADIINTGFNAIQEENKQYCFGPIVVAIAFKTTDGQTFWTGRWFIVNPNEYIRNSGLYLPQTIFVDKPYCVTPSNNASRYSNTFTNSLLAQYGCGYISAIGGNIKSVTLLAGAKVNMRLSLTEGTWNPDTSTIQSVEIFASRPQLYVNPNDLYGEVKTYSGLPLALMPKVPYEEIDLGNELLYFQKSISLKDLAANAQTFTFEFGGNIQTTNKTLEVDAGAKTRYGKVLSYNARFHFFDSISLTDIGIPEPDIDFQNIDEQTWYIYARYDDGGRNTIRYLGTKDIKTRILDGDNDPVLIPQFHYLLAASLNVKEVILYTTYPGEHTTTYCVRKYAMSPSSRYNYVFNNVGEYAHTIRETPTDEILELQSLITATPDTVIFKEEPDAINVTEQYNPFVFRVEHSYLAPGKIIDLQPQMVTVSDISTGEYPLNVFTNRGTYALLQGTGTVLYGAMRPISNLISESNSVPTENGTFIIAAGGVWAIAGRTAVLVSDALSEGPHKYIRSCESYRSISRDHYNVASLVSSPRFEEFLRKAAMSYNRFRDEIIISNPDYDYSYVLSLKYRQWFKISASISQDTIGSDIVITETYYPTYEFILKYTNATAVQVDEISHAIADNAPERYQLDFAVIYDDIERQFDSQEDYVLQLDYCTEDEIAPIISALTQLQLVEDEDFFFDELANTLLKDVYSLEDEQEGTQILLHLQSRPFSFAYQYSHVHRIVAMIRANLVSLATPGDLTVALYGSDDLQDWHLLTYANRTNVKFSQIRTASTARSWRYYTLCVGGTCPEDTDFGPILVDYAPVVRRLG